jgi:hypothetical protein
VRQTILLSASCALLGGVVGASVVSWIKPAEPSNVSAGSARPAEQRPPVDAALLRRVESLEQSLRTLQARGAAAPQSVTPTAGAVPAAGASTAEPSRTFAPVVDPVFEAAVLDILERAEDDRDSERDVRRSERARQQAEHWTQELKERLALSAAQAAKLLELRTQLTADLRERNRETEGGQFVPREQRRKEREALRERAERHLRDMLEPQQEARYDELEPRFKLVRPPDED